MGLPQTTAPPSPRLHQCRATGMDGEAVALFGPAPAPSDGQMANDAGPPADREALLRKSIRAHIQRARENEERALAAVAGPTTCDGQLPGSAVLSGPVPDSPMSKTEDGHPAAGPAPALPAHLCPVPKTGDGHLAAPALPAGPVPEGPVPKTGDSAPALPAKTGDDHLPGPGVSPWPMPETNDGQLAVTAAPRNDGQLALAAVLSACSPDSPCTTRCSLQ